VHSAVIRRSNEFEDFRCHKSVKVSHSVTQCNIYIIPNWYVYTFLCVTLCHSVKHVMSVTFVTCVILVTNIIVMCHWSSNVS
jgi:hypothetical protein